MTEPALKRTPLFDEHVAAGARLVDFGGWEMPLHYGSQLEEHHRVRRDAGVFDVSHMLAIDVSGADAGTFLRALLANDVARLAADGKALYSCMLRDDGGILDDLIVYLLGPGRFRLVVNAGTAQKDLRWIVEQRDRMGCDAEVQPRHDLAMLAVQGPEARERLWQVWPAVRASTQALAPFSAASAGDALIARTGYTGEDGFEVMLPSTAAPGLWRDLIAAGVAPCGLGARDTLRLEAGLNLYGQDMDEGTTPFEAGLGWTVSTAGGRSFVGADALARSTPRFELRGLVLLDRGVLRSHQRVQSAHGSGEITSGTFSPTLNRSIALARLPGACAPGERVEVEIRERRLSAEVVNYPFVRKGKSLLPAQL
jgi:glycine cleavage system T protein (aminomethyltransferase)